MPHQLETQSLRSKSPGASEKRFTLKHIRAIQRETARHKAHGQVTFRSTGIELETYLNNATFDLSLRLSAVERCLKSGSRVQTQIPELLGQIKEARHELEMCSEIGNFALRRIGAKR